MKGRVQSIEVSYFVHSTEDKERIDISVKNILGLGGDGMEEELEGHHGNRIIRVSCRITGETVQAVLERLVTGLAAESRKDVVSNVRAMMDEHFTLYLRLNKQSIVEGRLETGGRESVRIRVKPRLFLLREGAEQFYRSVFEGEG